MNDSLEKPSISDQFKYMKCIGLVLPIPWLKLSFLDTMETIPYDPFQDGKMSYQLVCVNEALPWEEINARKLDKAKDNQNNGYHHLMY